MTRLMTCFSEYVSAALVSPSLIPQPSIRYIIIILFLSLFFYIKKDYPVELCRISALIILGPGLAIFFRRSGVVVFLQVLAGYLFTGPGRLSFHRFRMVILFSGMGWEFFSFVWDGNFLCSSKAVIFLQDWGGNFFRAPGWKFFHRCNVVIF